MSKLKKFWGVLFEIWYMLSKPVFFAVVLWLAMAILFLINALTVPGAIVIGTGAILSMIMSLREE